MTNELEGNANHARAIEAVMSGNGPKALMLDAQIPASALQKPVIFYSGAVEIYRTRNGTYRAQIETIHNHPAHGGEDLHDADTSRLVTIHFREDGSPGVIQTKNSIYMPKDKDNG